MCSTPYNPGAEHEVHPLYPALGFDSGLSGEQPQLSGEDAAPWLAQAAEMGLLPRFVDCVAYRAELSGEPSAASRPSK
jgi:dTDP-4-dehydrorhamnose 3,5-epimerase